MRRIFLLLLRMRFGRLPRMSEIVYQPSFWPQMATPTQADVLDWMDPLLPYLTYALKGVWNDFLHRRGTDQAFREIDDVADVAHWITSQTCIKLRKMLPLRPPHVLPGLEIRPRGCKWV